MSNTEKLLNDGRRQLGRFSRWLSDRLEGAPELDEVRDFASQKSRQAVEATRDRVEEVGKWLGDLAVEMNVIEPPKKRKTEAAAAGVAVVAVAAVGWYLFSPKAGKARRRRIRNYFSGFGDRIASRIDDADVIVDGDGDLKVVSDAGKVSGLEGVKLNG
jgi:hypothetical protein